MQYEKWVDLKYKELQELYNEEDYGVFSKKRLLKRYNRILSNDAPLNIAFNLLNTLSSSESLSYTFFYLLHKEKKDEEKALQEFINSTAYAYLEMSMYEYIWECPKVSNRQKYEFLTTVSRYMSQCLIAGWEKEGYEIAEIMIESIDFGYETVENRYQIHKIIAQGYEHDLAGWFILELYNKVHKRDFNRDNAKYPNTMIPYDIVLEQWNTTDLSKVNELVTQLCEKHMEQTQEQKTNNDYFEFGDTFTWLFPYEIFTWFKFRQKVGLTNPKTFTHPLMNTPITKMFLDIKEPLPKPKELPYAKELLIKLQEKCPKVSIPDWL